MSKWTWYAAKCKICGHDFGKSTNKQLIDGLIMLHAIEEHTEMEVVKS